MLMNFAEQKNPGKRHCITNLDKVNKTINFKVDGKRKGLEYFHENQDFFFNIDLDFSVSFK